MMRTATLSFRTTLRVWMLCLLCGLGARAEAQSNVAIEGMGYFENRNLAARLAFLHGLAPDEHVTLDAVYIEDSAFLLIEQVKRSGYLRPTLEAKLFSDRGESVIRWEGVYSIQLAADFVAQSVVFEVRPGVLYHYDSVVVDGVPVLERDRLNRFFIPDGVLFRGKSFRVFTYENLDRRVMRLLATLDAMGYRSVREHSREVKRDDVTGATQVTLALETGPLHRVGRVEVVEKVGDRDSTTRLEPVEAGTVFTRDWEQDTRRRLRNAAYVEGYPDAEVWMTILSQGDVSPAGELVRDLRFVVRKGDFALLNNYIFRGDEDTRRTTLARQVNLKIGAPLNLLSVAEARRKIMGLGIHKQVGFKIEPADEGSRNLIYELSPNVRRELKLLGGWGSYEQARVGLNWQHRNLFGRAHRYELSIKQSLKASRLSARYSVPQLFGSSITGYSNAEYSYREELSFDRTKAGVSFGASSYLLPDLRFSAEYSFFLEDADRDDQSEFDSEEKATVASLALRLSYDRRDDFLAPSAGYDLFFSFELATALLGGSVDFQKIEAGGSYHFALGKSTLVHMGFRGGVIYAYGNAEDNIPFNERFFPGGENSVRGYREGRASPLDESGDEIGSELYLLGNLELEQRILRNFSLVSFLDVVGLSRDGFSGSERDVLTSAGIGLRYQTVVGPLRLEYGHNLNPRADDPDGVLHLSVGFPF